MNEGDAARVQAPGVQMEIIMGNAVWRGVLACALAAGLCAATPAAELVIGQVTSLSGPGGAELGQGLRDGAACAFDEVNREGGVNGNRLRLVTLDDRYTPALTVQKTRELLASERPVVLTAFRGTANTLALVKSGLLDESGVALVGSLTGAAELQGVPGIFHTRPSYASEIGKLVDGLLNIQQTRIGVVYENDSFGANGLAAVETALRTRNLKPVGAALAAEFGTQYATAPESEWLDLFREKAVAAMMDMIRADLALLGIHHDIFASEAGVQKAGNAPVEVGIRPEHVRLVGAGDPAASLPGTVQLLERLGNATIMYVDTPAGQIVVQDDGDAAAHSGDNVGVLFDPARVHVFTADARAA